MLSLQIQKKHGPGLEPRSLAEGVDCNNYVHVLSDCTDVIVDRCTQCSSNRSIGRPQAVTGCHAWRYAARYSVPLF